MGLLQTCLFFNILCLSHGLLDSINYFFPQRNSICFNMLDLKLNKRKTCSHLMHNYGKNNDVSMQSLMVCYMYVS